MYGGQTQYMPLKVNYAGVMPIIFAWALLLFPATIVSYGFKNSPTANRIASELSTGWPHYVALGAMIFFFSYFWVATQFQPAQIAVDHLIARPTVAAKRRRAARLCGFMSASPCSLLPGSLFSFTADRSLLKNSAMPRCCRFFRLLE